MSNYLFLNQEKSAEMLVPLIPVDYNLQAQNDKLIYVPLATKNSFGVIKVGDGLEIEHGVLRVVGGGGSSDITKLSQLENDVGFITGEDVVTLTDTQIVQGIKIFTETIGLLNVDGTLDRIRHINNNFLIVDQNGTALLDIDEGFGTIKSFGKELAFVEDIPNLSDVPTKVSDLINDTGFITNTVDNLVNYYLKTEQYTKEEINELVSRIPKFDVEIVDDPDTIPEEERSETTIYLVPRTDGELNDYYDEIIWIHNTWERLGSTKINLSNYYTKTDSDTLFLSKTDANSTFAKIIDIPTKVSELENDSGFLDSIPSEYITESELNNKNYATKGEIPTSLSQLQNDSGFITAAEIPEGGILYDTIGENTDGAMSQAASTNAFALKSEIPDISDFITIDDVPTELKDFNEDTTHRTVTDAEKAAWNNKVDKVAGMGLSEANFTTEEKTKLEGIEVNAQVNTVNSVNGKTGNVVLSASDVGALPSDTEIPTTASDVSALPNTTKYGASLSLSMNTSAYVVTAQLKDQDGNNLGPAQTIDLPLESVVVSGAYNNTTKKVVLTLKDGSAVDFSVADLIDGLVSQTSFSELENEVNNKVDKISGKGLSTNDYTTAEKNKLAGLNNYDDTALTNRVGINESNISINAQNINDVANSRYTKAEVNNLIKDFITKEVNDLTNYYTSAQIDAKGYLTSIPSNYVTESELGIRLNDYAHTSSVDNAFTLINDLRTDLTSLEETVEGLAGSSDLSDRVSTLETNQELIGAEVEEHDLQIIDLQNNKVSVQTWASLDTNVSALYDRVSALQNTVNNIPTKTSQLTNDSGFITISDLPTIPDTSNMVTTDTTQTISGAKTFTGAIIVPDVTIS